MLDDDAVDAEPDRLVHHVGLERGVLAAVEHPQFHAERIRLALHAGEIGLEEVAGREIAHERDRGPVGAVEGRRRAGDALREGRPRHQRDGGGERGFRECSHWFLPLSSFSLHPRRTVSPNVNMSAATSTAPLMKSWA